MGVMHPHDSNLFILGIVVKKLGEAKEPVVV